MILVLVLALVGSAINSGQSALASADPNDPTTDTNHAAPRGLNIRLSVKAIHAPSHLVKQERLLTSLAVAPSLVKPDPQSAILENDTGQRVVILSLNADGAIAAQALEDINLDAVLPHLRACAEVRQCALDRTPLTGGLGCLAMCMREALDATDLP